MIIFDEDKQEIEKWGLYDKYRDVIDRILTGVVRITQSTDDVAYKTIFDRKTEGHTPNTPPLDRS